MKYPIQTGSTRLAPTRYDIFVAACDCGARPTSASLSTRPASWRCLISSAWASKWATEPTDLRLNRLESNTEIRHLNETSDHSTKVSQKV